MHHGIPDPLTIILTRRADGSDRVEFVATSAQFDGLVGSSHDPSSAVGDLLGLIMEGFYNAHDDEPLPSALVDALLSAGYSMDVVEAWDRIMHYGLRNLRYDADAALSALRDYDSAGVPPLAACDFLPLPLGATDAARLHAAGLTAADVIPYVEWSATDKWYHWDFDVVPWALSGIPAERAYLYSRGHTIAEALAWEPFVEEQAICDDDLRDILRADFTPVSAQEYQAQYGHTGISLGEAARAKLALLAGPPRSSWGSPF